MVRAGWQLDYQPWERVTWRAAVGILLYYSAHYYGPYRRAGWDKSRLEARLQKAELRALKAQLNPHFLFNSLNTVRALILRQFEVPRGVVTALSELLWATLSLSHVERITLENELEVGDKFLGLEQLRHVSRWWVE